MTGAITALLTKDIMTQKANVILGGFYSLIFFLGFGLVGSKTHALAAIAGRQRTEDAHGPAA